MQRYFDRGTIMRGGGRKAREANRTRTAIQLAKLFRHVSEVIVPWLSTVGVFPEQPFKDVNALRLALGNQVRTKEEARFLTDALLIKVKNWNKVNPNLTIGAPGAIKMLSVRSPAWVEDSLDDLKLARAVRDGFEATWGTVTGIYPKGMPKHEARAVIGGLAIASALFDSGCLVQSDLELFASWLADWQGRLYDAPGLPPWIELKQRKSAKRYKGKKMPLREGSGKDDLGEYALRRLFLAPRTLELVERFDRVASVPGALEKRAIRPNRIVDHFKHVCGYLGHLDIGRLLKGSALLLQASPHGPDHTLALLASRKMQTYAANPESWKLVVQGGFAQEKPVAMSTPVDPVDWSRGKKFARSQNGSDDRSDPLSRLKRAMSQKLTKDEVSQGAGDVVNREAGVLNRRLKCLKEAEDLPSCIQLLIDWYLDMLEAPDSTKNRLKPSSVIRYHSSVAVAFYEMARDVELRHCSQEMIEELYALVLEADTRGPFELNRLRSELGKMHRFAMKSDEWAFPDISEDLLVGVDATKKVHSTLLSREQINRAREILRYECGLAENVAMAADAAMLAMSRGGLRIGEVVKALYRHYEQVEHSELEKRNAVLFVRPSAFGRNKTSWAYRQIRLFDLMTQEEARDFEEYLQVRRMQSEKGPLFGVRGPDGAVVPFDESKLGKLIAECLYKATGLEDATAHALRRAAASGLFLAIHQSSRRARGMDATLAPFLEKLTGWKEAEWMRAAEVVAPSSQSRDRWQSLARFMGHGAPEMTFGAYVTLADLAINESCAYGASHRDQEWLLSHISMRREKLLPVSSHPDPLGQKWYSGNNSIEAFWQALTYVDKHGSPVLAERAAGLSAGFIDNRLATAKAWRSLETSRGKKRLQPDKRQDCLAPAPLRWPEKRQEAFTLAARLIESAQSNRGQVEDWLRMVLNVATPNVAGTSLKRPNDLVQWCDLAVELADPGRWLIERLDPPGCTPNDMRNWQNARDVRTKSRRLKRKAGNSISVRCRYLSPAMVSNEGFLSGSSHGALSKESWDGCVRFASHLAAIYLNILPSP